MSFHLGLLSSSWLDDHVLFLFLFLTVVSVKSVGSLSWSNSSSNPLRQSVASEPLSRNVYVVICLLLPGPLTFTGTTLKQTLGRLFLDVSTGADSLKVHDTVTG